MLFSNVCLQANNCLRSGKQMFGYGQTFQRSLHCPSIEYEWYFNRVRMAPQRSINGLPMELISLGNAKEKSAFLCVSLVFH